MANRRSIGIGKGFFYYYDTLSPMESFYAKGKKKAKKKYYPDLKPVMNGELEKLLKYFKL